MTFLDALSIGGEAEKRSDWMDGASDISVPRIVNRTDTQHRRAVGRAGEHQPIARENRRAVRGPSQGPDGSLTNGRLSPATAVISERDAATACRNEGSLYGRGDRPVRSGAMGKGEGAAHSAHAQRQNATSAMVVSTRPNTSAAAEPVRQATVMAAIARKAKRPASPAMSVHHLRRLAVRHDAWDAVQVAGVGCIDGSMRSGDDPLRVLIAALGSHRPKDLGTGADNLDRLDGWAARHRAGLIARLRMGEDRAHHHASELGRLCRRRRSDLVRQAPGEVRERAAHHAVLVHSADADGKHAVMARLARSATIELRHTMELRMVDWRDEEQIWKNKTKIEELQSALDRTNRITENSYNTMGTALLWLLALTIVCAIEAVAIGILWWSR